MRVSSWFPFTVDKTLNISENLHKYEANTKENRNETHIRCGVSFELSAAEPVITAGWKPLLTYVGFLS